MTNGNESLWGNLNAEYHKNGDGLAYLTMDGGLTRREYFAAMAMQAILSATGKVSMENGLFVNEADLSVAVADALIKALNK